MILLLAVVLGLIAGLLRSGFGRDRFQLPDLRLTWLVFVALLPQLLAFYVPRTTEWFSRETASIALIVSQAALLAFVWLNRHLLAFWTMGAGLALNLMVIVANGGLMPISPQTIARLLPDQPLARWVPGERLGATKDIILSPEGTRLPWLSDRFVTPEWYPQLVAFSFGDVLIALGVFLLLWQAGGPAPDAWDQDSIIERQTP